MRTYTLAEVAEILQLSKRTVYPYVRTGALKGVKIGKYWRVSESALNDFLATGAEVEEANRRRHPRKSSTSDSKH